MQVCDGVEDAVWPHPFPQFNLTEGFQTVNAPDVKMEGETFCELPLSAEERVKIAEGIDAHTLRLH